MSELVYDISLFRMSLSLVPILIVIGLYMKWKLPSRTIFYATARMLVQLIAIGYFLAFIFSVNHPLGAVAIILFMSIAASWIALRPVSCLRLRFYAKAWIAITFAGIIILLLVIGCILQLKTWYEPRYLIPIAGMVFAQSMNAVSLAVDRFSADLRKGAPPLAAQQDALKTSLLPMTNAFFAVGLVSLPGMMTGQILAGVSPLVAVRYQIMVMGMLFGVIGIAATLFLKFLNADDIHLLKQDIK